MFILCDFEFSKVFDKFIYLFLADFYKNKNDNISDAQQVKNLKLTFRDATLMISLLKINITSLIKSQLKNNITKND